MTIQFQDHPANNAVAYLWNKIMFVFILFIAKTFWGSQLSKYLINIELMTFSNNKIQAKTFTWPEMSFLCSIGYIDVSNKGIEQACS